jgi:hypothetical protein
MAELIDWAILSKSDSVTTVIPEDAAYSYDLFNLTTSEALVYGERDWGINLRWRSCDGIRQATNVRLVQKFDSLRNRAGTVLSG